MITKHVTILVLSLIFVSCGESSNTDKADTVNSHANRELTVSEKYPMPWRDANREEFISIGRALVKNNITGCGIYYIRSSAQNSGEYLVGCSEEGDSWLYYLVWIPSEEVMGPYADNDIEKPTLQ